MRWLLTTVLFSTLFQAPLDPGLHNTTLEVEGVGQLAEVGGGRRLLLR